MNLPGRATPARLRPRWRVRAAGALTAAVAIPAALALALPTVAAAAPPMATQQVNAAAAPGYSVSWVNDRQLAVTIQSPSMGVPITVGVLLPRTWNSELNKTYPAYLLLDGFRVPDNSSDWFNQTDIEDFFRDKDSLVVTAYGGEGSFYSDWNVPDPAARDTQGNMVWDRFWNDEVPQVLSQGFRFNGNKAVGGLSMGGTAAYNYATLHPGEYKAVASYSGYLHTTSQFFPQLLQYSISSNTDLNPNNLWGDPATNPAWPLHDPFVQAQNPQIAQALRGTSLYVSAGDGVAGPFDGPSFLGLSENYVGQLLEIASIFNSRSFTNELAAQNIAVNTDYYAGGSHSWPYWQRQLKQSWPQIGAALGLSPGEIQGTGGCFTSPVFAGVAQSNQLGGCTTTPYGVPGGQAQDFFGGRAFVANGQAPGALKGAIGAKFQELGGTGGSRTNPGTRAPANVNGLSLGLPTTGEVRTPNGAGAFNDFSLNNTHIYWSPATGAHEIGGAIFDKWGTFGYEGGEMGFPTTDESVPGRYPNARYNAFQFGQVLWAVSNGAHQVKGAILDFWLSQGGTFGRYGLPRSDEFGVDGGLRQDFDGGSIGFINGQIVP